MKLNEYQEATRRTTGEFQSESEELIAWSMGIAGEGGEIVDYVKKVVFHGHELNKEKLMKELGDEMYYLTRMADLLGYTLESVAKGNIDKLQKRYPKGFSQEASRNRVDD